MAAPVPGATMRPAAQAEHLEDGSIEPVGLLGGVEHAGQPLRPCLELARVGQQLDDLGDPALRVG